MAEMKSNEEISKVFEDVVEESANSPLTPYREGVRSALGWVLGEYEESPLDAE